MTDDPQAMMGVSVGLILGSVLIIILFIIFVHTMPGKIAKKRGNPQTEAIEILSLLGLLIFPFWMVALVWAYVSPFSVPVEVVDVSIDDKSEPDTESNTESAEPPVEESGD